MSEWNLKKLEEILTLEYGKSLPARNRKKGDIPVIGSSGIVDYHSEALVQGPGIVVGRKGSIGTAYYLASDFYPIDTVFYVVTDTSKYSLKFLYYWLKQSNLSLLNSDAAVPGLNRNVAYSQQAWIPTINTQHRIAYILSTYDSLIENNTQRIYLLEQTALDLYREWFVEYRFPGHEEIPRTESELGQIPQGWQPKVVVDAIEINPRMKLDKDKENQFISMGALSESSMIIDTSDMEYRKGNSGAKFMNDDTLFARITPSLENGKTGYVQFLPEGAIGRGSTEFIVMRSKTVTPEWVYCLARLPEFRRAAEKTMTGASGRQRVQYEFFDNYIIAHPDQKTLEGFSEIVKPTFDVIYNLIQRNEVLRETRDLLLPRLVSGQLDVSNIEISYDGA